MEQPNQPSATSGHHGSVSATVKDCHDHDVTVEYETPQNIGHGSFGTVSKCQLISPTNTTIAIKRVLQDKRFKNRELQIMKSLDNPNVTRLFYYSYDNDTATNSANNLYLNLIMEYLPTTLYKRNQFFTMRKLNMPLQEVRNYMFHILGALEYLHSRSICHRDIKPQNILVDHQQGIAKICDFGSAKILSPSEQNVSYICSRYYRAPELIFGATNYTTKIDMWSTGCVFAELLIGQPLFPGESGIDQLVEIIKILGTPTTDDIMAMNNNYIDHKFPLIKKIPLSRIFKNLNNANDIHVLNFLEKFLLFNPNTRVSATEALQDGWFEGLK
ncbi:unnamed protein product [Cyberlindnera jadinii]|uniref:Pkinase-domain-containing protein n=1 Tax=Cyberlindnera jadinii (strain ATCC 18201 / CBS 1600 / BCRC 20928 / JCM 3617 / NBRC 0987 / NRRL Y-1542) TaxID=983966 RepID=A0A0H5BYN0_CYBJN|nr:Pkinase-domain-containing protein [Cyberlindnera jadinii NRRL Y-1542]ODV75749.1 Pkinase-domain-containing protein [Cyberlindnera jadinii NRRL Y-1542]CEP20466.1 unnamed protein product [Cyberlindnera jadinii]